MMTPHQEQVNQIRVISVTKDGLPSASSSLGDRLAKLHPSGFVAIDTEFSGLADDSDLKDDNLQKRYTALRRVAHSRAIFSVGISIFNPVNDENSINREADKIDAPQQYDVSTYDFLLSCQSNYAMTPSAGTFLEVHGFDFNRMFRSGIPYHRAADLELKQQAAEHRKTGHSSDKNKMDVDGAIKPNEPPPATAPGFKSQEVPFIYGNFPRGLLWRIGRHAVPIIVHNGLLDLVFMYAAFQGALPERLNEFVAALLDCVPAGYWDSKVIAPTSQVSEDLSKQQHRASFLSYLFAKAVLDGRVSVKNSRGLPDSLLTDPPKQLESQIRRDMSVLCAMYAFRGFCPRGTDCPFAHDPFRVVIEEREGHNVNDLKEANKRHKEQSKKWKRQIEEAKAGISKLSKKQRKRKLNVNALPSNNNLNREILPLSSSPTDTDASCSSNIEDNKRLHTAGWDAFCTGYIFAAFRASVPPERLSKHHNYIALPFKFSDLLLRKSEYANLDG